MVAAAGFSLLRGGAGGEGENLPPETNNLPKIKIAIRDEVWEVASCYWPQIGRSIVDIKSNSVNLSIGL